MDFPVDYQDILGDSKRALLFLATTMPDGSPQVTPIWFNTQRQFVLINTAEGRVKDRNMRARPRVAAVVQDPEDIYRYLQVRGEVVERTYVGADEHINALSLKYDDKPWKPKAGETRVIYKIRPTHFDLH